MNSVITSWAMHARQSSVELQAAIEGEKVDVWFYETTDHESLERELLRNHKPAWNIQSS